MVIRDAKAIKQNSNFKSNKIPFIIPEDRKTTTNRNDETYSAIFMPPRRKFAHKINVNSK